MLHTPVVLDKAVLISPIFMQKVKMMEFQVSLEVFAIGKLHVWIAFISLPVCAALPPSVATRGIVAIAVVEAVGYAKVARYKILEGMTNLVGHSRTVS
ncbi:unknown [Prevotella sp. CAG:1092]|nr:unknown [Prevotella sp. CAG:1092]